MSAIVVWPCGLSRERLYITAHTVQGVGFSAGARDPRRHAVAALLGRGFRVAGDPPPGLYFAMITLALAQMVYFVALQARFTGGEDGIQAIRAASFWLYRSQRHA